ncbi:hypothetical protein [Phyllobacterium sophorae]|uniref:hypothetical protein n=1 Tax=Phyllobacterium sophorae TaxID=1520277 RepID=UPI001FE15223|nr:hypothetical protein [Phyllobacterium sophorae]
MVLQRAQDGWRELKAFVVDIDVGFSRSFNKGASRLRAGNSSRQGVTARLARLNQLFGQYMTSHSAASATEHMFRLFPGTPVNIVTYGMVNHACLETLI